MTYCPAIPEKEENGLHLYIIQSAVTGAIKVGRSGNPDKRLKSLQTGSPYPLRIILVLDRRGWQEKALHERLSRFHTKGEWFLYQGLAGGLPLDIYEQLDLEVVDNWWVKL